MRLLSAGLLAPAFLALLVAPRALPCSICRCGDPTFGALGTDVYVAGRFRLALDWERFDKESGREEPGTRRAPAHEAPEREHEVEHRVTATLAYSFGETPTAAARSSTSRRARW